MDKKVTRRYPNGKVVDLLELEVNESGLIVIHDLPWRRRSILTLSRKSANTLASKLLELTREMINEES